jgi:hypothetical protein
MSVVPSAHIAGTPRIGLELREGTEKGLDLRTLPIQEERSKLLPERHHPAIARWAPLQSGKTLALAIMLVVLAGMLLFATPTLPAPDNLVPPVGSYLSAETDGDGASGALLFCTLVLFSIPPVRWGLVSAPCEISVLRSAYCSDLERPG